MLGTKDLIYGAVVLYFIFIGTFVASGIGSALFLGIIIMFSSVVVLWLLLKYKTSKELTMDEAEEIIKQRAYKIGWLSSSEGEPINIWVYNIPDNRMFSKSGRLWWGIVELENGKFGSLMLDEKSGEPRGKEREIDYIPSPLLRALKELGTGTGNIGYGKSPFKKKVLKVETSKKEETKS